MFTDHFFQKRVQPPQDPLYTYRRTDIQTDSDYIKCVVHSPPGDHTLKNSVISTDGTPFLLLKQENIVKVFNII